MPKDAREKDIIEADIPAEEKYRAPANEGWRAPFLGESGSEPGAAQHSIYDGAGNETVVVTTTNEEGVRKQGTGKTAEEAAKDARSSKEPIGEGFNPPPGH